MDVNVLTIDELRGYEKDRMKEVESDIRRRLVELKMDIYTPAAAHSGQRRRLKKNLARLLTVKSEATATKKTR